MDKKQVIEKYGEYRIRVVHRFLDKINRYYGFPFHDDTIYDFAVDLDGFSNADLAKALKILEDRETDQRLKFNEIKACCVKARTVRVESGMKIAESQEEYTISKEKREENKKKINELINTLFKKA